MHLHILSGATTATTCIHTMNYLNLGGFFCTKQKRKRAVNEHAHGRGKPFDVNSERWPRWTEKSSRCSMDLESGKNV